MNKVFLIGNLTRDPERAETPSGVAVCKFSIAVNRFGGEETDFFNITAWRTTAENCGKYLAKGRKVAIIGSLQNRSYEDRDGVKRNVTDIIAQEVQFLTPTKIEQKPERHEEPEQQYIDGYAPPKRKMPTLTPVDDDDNLPF